MKWAFSAIFRLPFPCRLEGNKMNYVYYTLDRQGYQTVEYSNESVALTLPKYYNNPYYLTWQDRSLAFWIGIDAENV